MGTMIILVIIKQVQHKIITLIMHEYFYSAYYIVDLVVTTFVLAFCNVTSNLQNSVCVVYSYCVHLEEMCLSFENYINVVCDM